MVITISLSGCASTTPTFVHHVTGKDSEKKPTSTRNEVGFESFIQLPINYKGKSNSYIEEAPEPINPLSVSYAPSICNSSFCLDLFGSAGVIHLSLGAGATFIGEITQNITSSFTPFVALPIFREDTQYVKDMNDYNGIGLYGFKWNFKVFNFISHFGFERSQSYIFSPLGYNTSSAGYFHTFSIGLGGTYHRLDSNTHALAIFHFMPEMNGFGLSFVMGVNIPSKN